MPDLSDMTFGEFVLMPSEAMKRRPKTCSECLYSNIVRPCRHPCRAEYQNDPRWSQRKEDA